MVEAASSYPLLNAFWTMFIFFGFVIWIWLVISIFMDLFRRKDIGGWGKTGWTVFILVLPLIGVLAYLISQSSAMADRRRADAQASQQSFDNYVQSVATSSAGQPAAEIEQAKGLLDSGAITADEYEALKRKALAKS